MENYLEYIDAYFQRTLDPEEIRRFEQRITEDPGFADEVAFYLSAKQRLKAEADREKKEWFRQLAAEKTPVVDINQYRSSSRKVWIYRVTAAAAVIVCAFFVWYFVFSKTTSPRQMADNYINDNLKTLGVKMGEKDSLQEGLRLYNEGQYNSALQQFESMNQRDTANYLLKNYIG